MCVNFLLLHNESHKQQLNQDILIISWCPWIWGIGRSPLLRVSPGSWVPFWSLGPLPDSLGCWLDSGSSRCRTEVLSCQKLPIAPCHLAVSITVLLNWSATDWCQPMVTGNTAMGRAAKPGFVCFGCKSWTISSYQWLTTGFQNFWIFNRKCDTPEYHL